MSGLDWLVARPIAHRGLHDKANGIVENTITAADAAIARGLSIECDVQLTADDDAVVFHDFALDRLTAQAGEVATRTSTDLQAIAIEGSRSDRIPSLGSFLARIDGRVPLVVEIKSRFDGNMTLTKRTCDLLSGYGGPVVVKSFDPAVIATVRRIAPQIVRGIVAEAGPDELPPLRGVAAAVPVLEREGPPRTDALPVPRARSHARDELDRAHARRQVARCEICGSDGLRRVSPLTVALV
jgi:glycerophosphoryl diester phosphodiesterase